MNTSSPTLFTPLNIGPYELPNRIIMAPLTRSRASAGFVPNAMNAEYYAQRAGAGLIISEATQISQQGQGYLDTPGLYTDAQVQGWKLVTSAVHERGGRIFAQLWHVGRVSHQSFQPNGDLPVAPSALSAGGVARTAQGEQPRPVPRALETDEIPLIMNDYRRAAENALKAGFDGVEMHGANGYLPDQFLRDGSNRRTDQYGGPIENRARFHMEAVQACIDIWGPSRVGVRLSPSGTSESLFDSNPRATFSYLITKLGSLGLAYLHIMEAWGRDADTSPHSIPVSYFRPMFKGVLITNGRFTFEKAQKYLAEGWADAVAFGRLFIANPDLPERFRVGAPLNEPDPSTFYTPGPKGYTDYPALRNHSSAATR